MFTPRYGELNEYVRVRARQRKEIKGEKKKRKFLKFDWRGNKNWIIIDGFFPPVSALRVCFPFAGKRNVIKSRKKENERKER